MKTEAVAAKWNTSNLPMRRNCPAAVLLDGEDYYAPRGTQYLVSCNSLIDLDGSDMKRKRGLISRFKAANAGWSFEELAGTGLDDAFEVERLWQREEAEGEAAFVRRCFRSFAELNLIGGVLHSGGIAVGYSIAAPCGTGGALLLVIRAKPIHAGASAMLYRQTALLLKSRIPALGTINLGCSGGAVETRNRLSYHPQIIAAP